MLISLDSKVIIGYNFSFSSPSLNCGFVVIGKLYNFFGHFLNKINIAFENVASLVAFMSEHICKVLDFTDRSLITFFLLLTIKPTLEIF